MKDKMYKSILLAVCLATSALDALATPRAVVAAESRIEFVVKEMGVPVTGQFRQFDATIDIDPVQPAKSSAGMRIQVGSLTTGSDEADAIAVDADWLDKTRAPYAIFKSTAIRVLGGGRFEAKGTLSIRNKERDIAIQFNSTEQAGGKTLITSEFVIKRSEFGIGGGVWNEGGVVAEEIPVKVRLTLAPAMTKNGPTASR
jgi:polyisoprenoid-binding protein YceI